MEPRTPSTEVLPYYAFRKTASAPILYWTAYRPETEGGYAGTRVMPVKRPVFTAPSEERLKAMAEELGYAIQPDTAG
jgi:hypothetical protein